MFLSVPATLGGMNEKERSEWSLRIARARIRLGLSKEAAAKRAGVTTTTWRRAEAGESLQDAKFAAVLAAVNLAVDEDADRIAASPEQPSLFLLPAELEEGYNATVQFTRTVSEHVPELARDATRLMIEASRLFAAAGDVLVGGGDQRGDAAPMNAADQDDLHIDLAAYPDDDQTDD